MILFRTSRTIIRPFVWTDLEPLTEMMTDTETMKFTGFKKVQKIEKIESLLRKWTVEGEQKLGVWAVEEIKNNALVGWFMLKKTTGSDPELGFMISKKFWNQGYASEVSKGFLEYGFSELDHRRIIASTVRENIPSIRVLEKIGMTRTATQSESDVIYYEIFSEANT